MTMQNPQSCLSAELLRQLSHDELSPAQLKDVEDHVSDCERCRQLLEVPQSDSQWQDEIVPTLRSPLESPHVAGDHAHCSHVPIHPLDLQTERVIPLSTSIFATQTLV